ncbi:MarR family winged helix-turn-helix transcriptional regulator [Cognatishimia sp. SS12]|uniref:MarR family winged helix-turn-helix transcriptional regulator n=1 Tax=Cognatishimia sp. SS12 TaxID=2979465 RepID=UPI00232E53BF|nr:MarR family winged helix-turn-helix transcriptional regulator [Cognatishimia sp. SS12]
MEDPLITEGDIDDYLNIRAVQMSNRLQLMVQRRALRPAGLPLQDWRIIVSLARYGSSHLRHITQRASLDPAHASRAASNLEKQGLITRRVDPNDSRRRLLSLTSAGEEMFWKIWNESMAMSQEINALFSKDELQSLKSYLDRVIHFADGKLGSDT